MSRKEVPEKWRRSKSDVILGLAIHFFTPLVITFLVLLLSLEIHGMTMDAFLNKFPLWELMLLSVITIYTLFCHAMRKAFHRPASLKNIYDLIHGLLFE